MIFSPKFEGNNKISYAKVIYNTLNLGGGPFLGSKLKQNYILEFEFIGFPVRIPVEDFCRVSNRSFVQKFPSKSSMGVLVCEVWKGIRIHFIKK